MNLFPKWWNANVKLINTIDSCESYEQLKLIEDWVYKVCDRYKLIKHLDMWENPIYHLGKAFSKFPPNQE